MTDVLPDRETLTQRIPHRAYGLYDTAPTAIIRLDERPIFDTRFPFQPLAEVFGPSTPEPEPEAARTAVIYPRHVDLIPGMGEDRPRRYRGRRRRQAPAWLLVMAGLAVGIPLGAAWLGSVLAAVWA